MKLKYQNKIYWLKTTFAERIKAEQAGFEWSRAKKLFWTRDPMIAIGFKGYNVDSQTMEHLINDIELIMSRIEKSHALDSDLNIPKPDGLEYLPFQKAGIEYSLERKSVLIADGMRLGKTIQAAGVINYTKPLFILVVCPATVKINWQRELKKWLVNNYSIGIAYSNKPLPHKSIIIINYDILKKFHKELHSFEWDLVILDESHYVKNFDAQRTQEIGGFKIKGKNYPSIKAKRKLALTGTPIESRPKELFPVLHYLDPKEFPSYLQFAKDYCGAFRDAYGWNFDGATNLDKLNQKLRSTVMVRRTKHEVFSDLPEKVRQIIELPVDGSVVKEERERMKEYKLQVKDLKKVNIDLVFDTIAAIRHETALAKVPMVVDHLKDILATGEKVVCFAWHRDVIALIDKEMREQCVIIPLVVTGKTSLRHRQTDIDLFQNSSNFPLFIGNMEAAGIGIGLHAASIGVFAEIDWVKVPQAEERLFDREKENAVLIQHLVLEGSIDAHMARIMVRKQDIKDQALDGKEMEVASFEPLEFLDELFENY